MFHPDQEVSHAIVRLCEALCSWERATGRRSILILREEGGCSFRADCGKPVDDHRITDAELLEQVP